MSGYFSRERILAYEHHRSIVGGGHTEILKLLVCLHLMTELFIDHLLFALFILDLGSTFFENC